MGYDEFLFHFNIKSPFLLGALHVSECLSGKARRFFSFGLVFKCGNCCPLSFIFHLSEINVSMLQSATPFQRVFA